MPQVALGTGEVTRPCPALLELTFYCGCKNRQKNDSEMSASHSAAEEQTTFRPQWLPGRTPLPRVEGTSLEKVAEGHSRPRKNQGKELEQKGPWLVGQVREGWQAEAVVMVQLALASGIDDKALETRELRSMVPACTAGSAKEAAA